MHLVTLPSSEALGDRDESIESGTAAPDVGLRVVHRQDGSTGTDQPLLLPDLQLCSNLTYINANLICSFGRVAPHVHVYVYTYIVLYSLITIATHVLIFYNYYCTCIYLFGRHWRSPCFDRCTQWPSNELPTLLSD